MKAWIIVLIIAGLLVIAGSVFFLIGTGQNTEGISRQNAGSADSSSIGMPIEGSDVPEMIVENTPQTYQIDIEDFSYKTKTLTIKKGDTVVWTNKDSVKHTVTSDSGNELDSALLAKGQSYSNTFTESGTFDYHCTPHPYMKGTVVVN